MMHASRTSAPRLPRSGERRKVTCHVRDHEIFMEFADAIRRTSEALDELDDVQKVHTNADIDEAALAETA